MRKFIIVKVLILILFCSPRGLVANNVRVARVFTGDQLGNSTYTSFCMDSFGFMWIGTDNGLIRFDGNHYSEYRHVEGNTESLSDNRILGLVKDTKERIWVATANGLNLYDSSKDSFKRIDIPDFGEKGYIISMAADEQGKITFVVAGVGIYEIEDFGQGDIHAKSLDSSDSLKDVNVLLSHSNGSLYAGTRNGVIYQFSNSKYWESVVEIDFPVFDMSEEQNGLMIINTSNGVFRFNPISKKLTRIKLKSDIQVNNLSNSVGGWIYLATYGAGLWKIHLDSDEAKYCNEIYVPAVNLKESRVGAVYGAEDGSLWIGDDFVGIVMVPPVGNSFIYRKVSNVIKDFEVPLTAMKVWKGNSVIGNCNGEIAIISPEGRALKEVKVPGAKVISSIDLIDNDKAILGVLNNDVWQLDLNTGEIKKLLELSNRYLSLMVCEGMDECIYIGAYSKGLLKYNPATGEKIWLSPDKNGKELLSPFITALKAYDDKIWIGAYGGLACYNIVNGKFEEIDQTPYLACAVYDIVQENETTFLIATSNGLIRYDTSSNYVQQYTTLDGLPDNDVRSVTIDGNGGKWIGTMRGLSYNAPGDEWFVSFASGDGMSKRSFEALEYFAETEKVIGLNKMGLTTFSPRDISLPVFQEALKVSDIYIKGKKLNPKDSSGYPEVINLSYDENSIAFRISTMDFRDTSNLIYLWRLAEDSEWEKLPEGTDMINLSSLPPGRYTLEFKAEEAGVESPVSVIKIHVAQPWYLTWMAKGVYLLIVMVLICLVLIIIRKRQKERLNAKKMDFFMDMSHDMRFPLTLILEPLESLLKENLSNEIREKIRGAYRNAHRILNTVNQLLDLKRFDYGKRKLQCRKTRLNEFIGEIVEMFRPQAQDKGITLTFDSKCEWNEEWIDRTVIDRIMSNLITYALKFTPPNGMVEVVLNKSKDPQLGTCVKINVLDNGIVSNGNGNSDLFRHHYRSDAGNSYAEDGHGLGLDICRRYAKFHHGEIRVENRRDGVQGSMSTVLIPLTEIEYEADELIVDKPDAEELKEEDSETKVIENKNIKESTCSEEFVPLQFSIPNLKGKDEYLIERINNVLEKRIDEEDMNVDSLAEAVGVSRSHLYRRMKERLGISPSDYIRIIRLKKASELLKNDDLDISQIAYALGFSSQSLFSSTFKRLTGYTPSEYRCKYKKTKNQNMSSNQDVFETIHKE